MEKFAIVRTTTKSHLVDVSCQARARSWYFYTSCYSIRSLIYYILLFSIFDFYWSVEINRRQKCWCFTFLSETIIYRPLLFIHVELTIRGNSVWYIMNFSALGYYGASGNRKQHLAAHIVDEQPRGLLYWYGDSSRGINKTYLSSIIT